MHLSVHCNDKQTYLLRRLVWPSFWWKSDDCWLLLLEENNISSQSSEKRLTTFQMVAKDDSHFVTVFWWMSKTFFTVWDNFLVLLNWWVFFNKHTFHNSQRNNYSETDHIDLHPKNAFNASILTQFVLLFFF